LDPTKREGAGLPAGKGRLVNVVYVANGFNLVKKDWSATPDAPDLSGGPREVAGAGP